MSTMTRSMVTCALVVLFGCGDDSTGGDGGTFSSQNCTTDWSCINGDCTCADGSACDDDADCETACEVCD
ncbi:MAG: hypothetical protein ABMB14_41045 [Myxococcota bacterium]